MKKYLSFFKLRFLRGIQYRAAAISGLVTQFLWGLMQILLFHAFYEANPEAFPVSFQSTASYIWLQQAFLALFMGWLMENDIFDSIQNGNIAYELCRPIDIYHMWFARNMASRLSSALLRCIPILVFAVFLPQPYGLEPPSDILTFLLFLGTMVLGFCLVVAYSMIIYITAIFTLDARGIKMLSLSVIEFFSGAVLPLPFFPDHIRNIMELLPFASMQNVPFCIYGGYEWSGGILKAVILQMVWLVLLIVLGKLMLRKGLKKVVVQGG